MRRADEGAAVIAPCYLGGADARLVRASPVLPDAASELWLLTHEDLRRTARVCALPEHMAEALAGERGLLEGQGAGTQPEASRSGCAGR